MTKSPTQTTKIALALGLLALLKLYIGLPYLLLQVANLGLVREGSRGLTGGKRLVALTFDDGPDPQTTPAVLDALQAAGAQATFFVLARNAEQHPDLIARMLREGHQVEAHAVRHVHAWRRTPWGAARDPGEAARRISAVTQAQGGPPVTLHRPPHGAYTLATWWGQRRAHLTGAHWSLEAHDWHSKYTPQMVRERLARLLVPGAVVVMHDAGPGARNTVPVLPEVLGDLAARNYQSVTLRDLSGAKPQDLPFLRRRAFSALDALYDRFGRIRYAGDRADNLFRVGPTRFPLDDLTLNDGTVIKKGAPAAEFHVNNALLVDLGPRRAVRQAMSDLQVVAHDLKTRDDLKNTQVFFCLSSLAPLLGLLQFENHDLSKADAQRLKRWANTLRRAYGNEANAKAPRLSILSRARFLELFGA